MSTYVEHVRRMPPKRDRPIRNPLVSPEKPGQSAKESKQSRETHARANGNGRLRESLEGGVETAYTVINDYLRRGYEAAQGNGDRSEPEGGMRDERQSYGPWIYTLSPMAFAMQQWLAAIRVWTDAWSTCFTGSGYPAWPQQMWNMPWPGYGTSPGCGMPPGYAGAPVSPPFAVHVSSDRAGSVKADVNLKPGAERACLTVGPLMNRVSTPIVPGVSINNERGLLKVQVYVQKDQPAGTYRREIRSSLDGSTCGDVTIEITDPPTKAS
jgi:hypothetical protein